MNLNTVFAQYAVYLSETDAVLKEDALQELLYMADELTTEEFQVARYNVPVIGNEKIARPEQWDYYTGFCGGREYNAAVRRMHKHVERKLMEMGYESKGSCFYTLTELGPIIATHDELILYTEDGEVRYYGQGMVSWANTAISNPRGFVESLERCRA